MMDTPTPESLRPGHVVGPWRVEGYGGRGTYGVVFRARRAGHPGSLPVALKLAVFAGDPRFAREVELLSRLRHPAVPKLVDRGWWHVGEAVHPYLVMEWIRGLPLYEWARVHRPTQRQVLRAVAQVAWGLEALHRSGGLHRDVKGDNILVEPEGRALLTDFGSSTWEGAPPLTDRIVAPGTTEYRSPEALRFQWDHWREKEARYQARPADDLYALGVGLYRLVTGIYPPPGTDLEAGEYPPVFPFPRRRSPQEQNARVLPRFSALIERMLAKAPEERGVARELAEAAEALVERAGSEADVPLLGPERDVPEDASVPVPRELRVAASPQRVSESSRVPEQASLLAGEDWPAPEFTGAEPVAEPASARESPSGEEDQDEVESESASVEEHSEPSGSLGRGLAAAAGVLMAVSIVWGSCWLAGEASEVAQAEALEDSAALDAGTRGLGDSTPTARIALDEAPVVMDARLIATELPEDPLPGQRRAPCRGAGQIEINGGCWRRLADVPPSCGEDGYEWRRACYYPVYERAKPRTSKKPR